MIVHKGDCVDPALVTDMSARLVRAITEPRLDELEDLLSDDFVVYYGFSGSSMKRDEAMPFFRSYFPTVKLRYDDIVCTPTTNGWVQQHLVNTKGADGFEIRDMPVCMVVTISGERISRIAEYFDSAQAGGFDASQMKVS
jgi:ketosteroid isomerase-like protein